MLFLLVYGALQWAYGSLRLSNLGLWFSHGLTARPAATAIGWLWPSDFVAAVGPRLAWPGGRLTLLAGCDGFEAASLFTAAMLVADVQARRCCAVLLAGWVAIWALNQVRIVALYWTFRHERDWFDSIHTFWGPLLLIAAVSALFAWAVGPWPALEASKRGATSAPGSR